MDAGNSEGNWVELADDLWGVIFSLLRPDMGDTVYQLQFDLQRFYAVRTVCKKFAAVFEQIPQLHSTLVLPSSLGRSLPRMYQWIQQHGNAVETLLSSSGSPWLEAGLAALEFHSLTGKLAPLTTVDLEDMPQAAIFLLARFTSITSCVLVNTSRYPDEQQLSLRALEHLPCLTSLGLLDGTFDSVNAPLHLSRLSLIGCQASCSVYCANFPALVELEVDKSRLSNFDSQGLSVCSKLQSLECMQSCIFDDQGESVMQFLENEPIIVDSNVSALNTLSKLCLSCCGGSDFVVSQDYNLGWLEGLTTLRDFSGNFAALSITLPVSLSCMNQLTSLTLQNCIDGTLWFSINWKGLVSLTQLSTNGVSIFHGRWPLSDLAEIRSLKHVRLLGVGKFVFQECDTAKTVEQLAARLGAERPDVSYECI